MNNIFTRPKDWKIEDYFTTEEIQQAQFEIDEMHRKKEEFEEFTVKEVERKESIRPDIIFNDYLTQVVYFLTSGKDITELRERVRKAMLCNMWSQAEWPVIKEVIQKQTSDAIDIIQMVENYYKLSPTQKDLMFIKSLTREEQKTIGINIKKLEEEALLEKYRSKNEKQNQNNPNSR